MTCDRSAGYWFMTVLLVGMCFLAGCGGAPSSDAPAAASTDAGGGANTRPTAATQPAGTATGALDEIRQLATHASNRYPVPDPANVEGTVAFLRRLAAERPVGKTNEEVGQDLAFMMASRFVAAENLIRQSARSEDSNQNEGQQARLDSLRALAVVGPSGSEALFREQCQSEIDSNGPQADFARQSLLLFHVDLVGGEETQDVEPIVKRVNDLVQQPQQFTENAYSAVAQAAIVLEQQGHSAAAVNILESLSARIRQSGVEKRIQDQLSELETTLPLLRLERLANQLGRGDSPATLNAVRSESLAILRNPALLKVESLALVSHSAHLVEFWGHLDIARELYGELDKSFGRAGDAKLAAKAAETVDFAQRRLGLVGQKFQVDGKLLNGQDFNWASYQGKVVLIDFWATWCGPCLQEIPNIRKSYDRFHDQGFDVVGINLDEDQQVDDYLQKKPLPWQTVIAADRAESGFSNPNAVRCGVEAIPFLVLVGRDGRVAAIHVRGERLAPEIERLLKQPGST